MAQIDSRGVIVPNPQTDTLRMFYVFGHKDYGRYDLGDRQAPSLGIHHATDSNLDYGEDAADMGAIGKRLTRTRANGKPEFPYVAHVYVGRDGHTVQLIYAHRATLACENVCIYQGARHENNNLGFQLEWHNAAYYDEQGIRWGWDATKKQKYVVKRVDPRRGDMRKLTVHYRDRDDVQLWQTVTKAQIAAVGEILRAVRDRWQVPGLNLLHGHYALAGGSHVDPGPCIIEALGFIGEHYLDLPPGFVVPASRLDPLPLVIEAGPVA